MLLLQVVSEMFSYICYINLISEIMEKHIFLAFDLGATSGRSILGTVANGKAGNRSALLF